MIIKASATLTLGVDTVNPQFCPHEVQRVDGGGGGYTALPLDAERQGTCSVELLVLKICLIPIHKARVQPAS